MSRTRIIILVLTVLAGAAGAAITFLSSGCGASFPHVQICGRVELGTGAVAFALCLDGRPIGAALPLPPDAVVTPLPSRGDR